MTTHWHLDPKEDGTGYVLHPLQHEGDEQTSEDDDVPSWETVKDGDDGEEAPAGDEG